MTNKTKIIGFRTTEDLFNKYSALNIKSKKMFVNKCNELLEKFLSINVNKPNVNKPNVNIHKESSVNSCKQSVNSHSEEISFSQKIKKSIPKGFDVNDFVKEL